ncbi:hypothetical protein YASMINEVIRUS_1141 [Yasminevirus sp. GU-2018]|uniref:Uncharacterized protein n=1 Tax=Yasminevirus sp. GU-2018 TaxID=2420051 RepID=A0A5K0U903_9VIRU|nr:hypothetical protein YASMINEVIRUS_1141 [Yasminevirus sp. GU-2018]
MASFKIYYDTLMGYFGKCSGGEQPLTIGPDGNVVLGLQLDTTTARTTPFKKGSRVPTVFATTEKGSGDVQFVEGTDVGAVVDVTITENGNSTAYPSNVTVNFSEKSGALIVAVELYILYKGAVYLYKVTGLSVNANGFINSAGSASVPIDLGVGSLFAGVGDATSPTPKPGNKLITGDQQISTPLGTITMNVKINPK